MNILFLTNKSSYQGGAFGGAESSIRLMAEKLVDRGHNIIYVTKNRSGVFFPRLEVRDIDGVDVFIFKTSYGYKKNHIIRAVNDLFFKKIVYNVAKKFEIELGYCFYELENLQLLNDLTKINPNFKTVMRMAGLGWYEYCKKKPSLIKKYEREFNRLNGVNFISLGLPSIIYKKLRELEMDVGFKDILVADIGSSFNFKNCEKDNKKKETSSQYVIVMASRFSTYQKRQDLLVRSLQHVSTKINIKLKLIGDGNERLRIQKLAHELGVSQFIEFIPFLEQEKLWQEMQDADLLCHACDCEGLGKVIIESMALGLPVLASNVEPINSYIKEDINGYLVENDPKLWAKKIEKVLNDSISRRKVKERAMSWVNEEHDPSKNVLKYESFFNELVLKPKSKTYE